MRQWGAGGWAYACSFLLPHAKANSQLKCPQPADQLEARQLLTSCLPSVDECTQNLPMQTSSHEMTNCSARLNHKHQYWFCIAGVHCSAKSFKHWLSELLGSIGAIPQYLSAARLMFAAKSMLAKAK